MSTLKTLLETKSKKKNPCYIHFTKKPSCQSPSAIFHHPEETYVLPKLLKAEGISFSSTTLHETEPLFWESRIPVGTISYWFIPLTMHSDDTFRYLFEKESLSSITYLIKALIKEYPNLKPLLQQKSFFLQQETAQVGIVHSLRLFHESHISLPQKAIRVLKIALMCHEIGYAFGSKEDRLYNSYPFAQIMAEKLGCSEEEQNMLELLFFDPSSPKSHELPPFDILFKEAFLARSHAISPGSWIPLKAAYQEALSSFQTKPTTSEEIELLRSFSKQTISSLCFGLNPLQGSLPTRRLFSSYIWEERDALHRDGIHLKRLREKYEQQILHTPHSPWKGKFWQWLDSKLVEKPLSPALYLKDEQKQSYCPIIFEGKLYTHERTPICSQELIFVIDGQNRLYVGVKKDGNGPEDPSFNHASFTSAAPVATSGKITLDAEGYPILLRNASGHYRPKIQETTLALLTLKERGIDIGRLQVEYSSDSIDKLPNMEGTRFLSLFQNSLKNSNAY
jgi:hypothetical protein